MDIVKHLKTNTTKFILPLLFDKGVKFDDILPKNFKNTYVADIDRQEVDDYILVAYDSNWDDIEDPNVTADIANIVYKKDDDLIYGLKIPDKFLDDYHLFLAGKYSQLSAGAKERILEFWDAGEETLLHGILYKTKVGRKYWETTFNEDSTKWSIEAEYWFPPNMQKEIL